MDQQTHPPLEHVDGGVHTSMKAKDGLSSGSGGSVVVDEDSPQLIDSGGSKPDVVVVDNGAKPNATVRQKAAMIKPEQLAKVIEINSDSEEGKTKNSTK
ncbi:hypothetical protein MRB53_012871 [Persea americana]|uniref:Uncharacterized protein n=1 Tax=Persea americana TaxID=3435 RepID=A0ACC2LYU0_PERAE|nr:hypothetical protein MRB53_012871 [Persea americana]